MNEIDFLENINDIDPALLEDRPAEPKRRSLKTIRRIALAAAAGIDGMRNAAVFSVGSDGTDGPTDAAGGYVDGETCAALRAAGLTVDGVLQENDAYHALEKTGGLIFTGPTGTNVNDVAVALLL